jgi:hypothetical protein
MALHEAPNDIGCEPIDQGPRSGVAKQLLDDRRIGRSKLVTEEVEQLDHSHTPLVDRCGPERSYERDDLVVAQRWIRRCNPFCYGADRGHARALVRQLALQVGPFVQSTVRIASVS